MLWISIISAIWYGISSRSHATASGAAWAFYGFIACFCPSLLVTVLGWAVVSIVSPEQAMMLVRAFSIAGMAAGIACSVILQRILVSRQKRMDAWLDRTA